MSTDDPRRDSQRFSDKNPGALCLEDPQLPIVLGSVLSTLHPYGIHIRVDQPRFGDVVELLITSLDSYDGPAYTDYQKTVQELETVKTRRLNYMRHDPNFSDAHQQWDVMAGCSVTQQYVQEHAFSIDMGGRQWVYLRANQVCQQPVLLRNTAQINSILVYTQSSTLTSKLYISITEFVFRIGNKFLWSMGLIDRTGQLDTTIQYLLNMVVSLSKTVTYLTVDSLSNLDVEQLAQFISREQDILNAVPDLHIDESYRAAFAYDVEFESFLDYQYINLILLLTILATPVFFSAGKTWNPIFEVLNFAHASYRISQVPYGPFILAIMVSSRRGGWLTQVVTVVAMFIFEYCLFPGQAELHLFYPIACFMFSQVVRWFIEKLFLFNLLIDIGYFNGLITMLLYVVSIDHPFFAVSFHLRGHLVSKCKKVGHRTNTMLVHAQQLMKWGLQSQAQITNKMMDDAIRIFHTANKLIRVDTYWNTCKISIEDAVRNMWRTMKQPPSKQLKVGIDMPVFNPVQDIIASARRLGSNTMPTHASIERFRTEVKSALRKEYANPLPIDLVSYRRHLLPEKAKEFDRYFKALNEWKFKAPGYLLEFPKASETVYPTVALSNERDLKSRVITQVPPSAFKIYGQLLFWHMHQTVKRNDVPDYAAGKPFDTILSDMTQAYRKFNNPVFISWDHSRWDTCVSQAHRTIVHDEMEEMIQEYTRQLQLPPTAAIEMMRFLRKRIWITRRYETGRHYDYRNRPIRYQMTYRDTQNSGEFNTTSTNTNVNRYTVRQTMNMIGLRHREDYFLYTGGDDVGMIADLSNADRICRQIMNEYAAGPDDEGDTNGFVVKHVQMSHTQMEFLGQIIRYDHATGEIYAFKNPAKIGRYGMVSDSKLPDPVLLDIAQATHKYYYDYESTGVKNQQIEQYRAVSSTPLQPRLATCHDFNEFMYALRGDPRVYHEWGVVQADVYVGHRCRGRLKGLPKGTLTSWLAPTYSHKPQFHILMSNAQQQQKQQNQKPAKQRKPRRPKNSGGNNNNDGNKPQMSLFDKEVQVFQEAMRREFPNVYKNPERLYDRLRNNRGILKSFVERSGLSNDNNGKQQLLTAIGRKVYNEFRKKEGIKTGIMNGDGFAAAAAILGDDFWNSVKDWAAAGYKFLKPHLKNTVLPYVSSLVTNALPGQLAPIVKTISEWMGTALNDDHPVFQFGGLPSNMYTQTFSQQSTVQPNQLVGGNSYCFNGVNKGALAAIFTGQVNDRVPTESLQAVARKVLTLEFPVTTNAAGNLTLIFQTMNFLSSSNSILLFNADTLNINTGVQTTAATNPANFNQYSATFQQWAQTNYSATFIATASYLNMQGTFFAAANTGGMYDTALTTSSTAYSLTPNNIVNQQFCLIKSLSNAKTTINMPQPILDAHEFHSSTSVWSGATDTDKQTILFQVQGGPASSQVGVVVVKIGVQYIPDSSIIGLIDLDLPKPGVFTKQCAQNIFISFPHIIAMGEQEQKQFLATVLDPALPPDFDSVFNAVASLQLTIEGLRINHSALSIGSIGGGQGAGGGIQMPGQKGAVMAKRESKDRIGNLSLENKKKLAQWLETGKPAMTFDAYLDLLDEKDKDKDKVEKFKETETDVGQRSSSKKKVNIVCEDDTGS